MNYTERGTVERAFDLARCGKYTSVHEIRLQLRREGYSSVEEHTAGVSIRKQLLALMAEKPA